MYLHKSNCITLKRYILKLYRYTAHQNERISSELNHIAVYIENDTKLFIEKYYKTVIYCFCNFALIIPKHEHSIKGPEISVNFVNGLNPQWVEMDAVF